MEATCSGSGCCPHESGRPVKEWLPRHPWPLQLWPPRTSCRPRVLTLAPRKEKKQDQRAVVGLGAGVRANCEPPRSREVSAKVLEQRLVAPGPQANIRLLCVSAYGCCKESPPAWWLKTTRTCSLQVLEPEVQNRSHGAKVKKPAGQGPLGARGGEVVSLPPAGPRGCRCL